MTGNFQSGVTFLECLVVKGLTLHDVQSLVYRNYISISISIHTDIDGHPEPRRFYRDMTSLVCLTVHLLLYKDIFLKYCFCTRAKTQNAATSLLLLYCRSVHGTVHLLYCINTHTLITVLAYSFYVS